MAGVINVATNINDNAMNKMSRNSFGKYSAVGLHIYSLLTLKKATFSRLYSLNSCVHAVSCPSLHPLITNRSIYLSDILKDKNSHSSYCPAHCRSVARLTKGTPKKGQNTNTIIRINHIRFLRRFHTIKFLCCDESSCC